MYNSAQLNSVQSVKALKIMKGDFRLLHNMRVLQNIYRHLHHRKMSTGFRRKVVTNSIVIKHSLNLIQHQSRDIQEMQQHIYLYVPSFFRSLVYRLGIQRTDTGTHLVRPLFSATYTCYKRL